LASNEALLRPHGRYSVASARERLDGGRRATDKKRVAMWAPLWVFPQSAETKKPDLAVWL
jgi:hypothetical protein